MAAKTLHRLRTTIDLRPRYAETDQMGVVYHANYLIWFHEARDALLAHLGLNVSALETEGYAFPIVETQCRHLSPARYGESVRISATPVLEGGQTASVARLCVHYEVDSAADRRRIAQGRTVNVMTDRNGRLLLRLPPAFDPLIRRFTEAAGSPTER